MSMFRFLGAGLLVWLVIPVSGQGKQTLIEKGIASITVQEYFIEEGISEPIVESIEKYNTEGELVEIQEFNRLGEVQRWEKYVFNDQGKLVEEQFLDEKGKLVRTEKTIYQDGLRAEKHYFNDRNKLFKKKVYVYEYRQ